MKSFDRRSFLLSLGLLSTLSPFDFLSLLSRANQAYALGTKKYFVFVRSVFSLRNKNRTNFNNDLGPLAPWSANLSVVQGLTTKGDGSEYHNGKNIRYATCCQPGNRNNRNLGGGAYDGKSVDVVVGEYLAPLLKARHPYLVLGAYPYSNGGLACTFGTVTFANKNQYVNPQYNMPNIVNQALAHGRSCSGGGGGQIDSQLLINENKVVEQVLADLTRSKLRRKVETAGQVEQLEGQFLALREDNKRKLNSDNTCTTFRETPLAHSYNRHNIVRGAYDTQLRRMNHAAALSLKSNLSRVVTLNYDFSGHSQPNVPGFHEMTHPGGFSRPPTNQELANLDGLSAFQMEMVAHLLKELGDMGLLNETLLVFSPHERPTHNHADVPVIAYGAAKLGQYERQLSTQDMCKDILDQFGVPNSNNFGGEGSKGGVLS